MRPPILSKYPVDKIISNFKSSKEKEMWIVRFIPQILNKQKINANAISVMKRISLLRLEPLTNQETDKIKKLMMEIGREDIKCVRQTESKQKNVLIFWIGLNELNQPSAKVINLFFDKFLLDEKTPKAKYIWGTASKKGSVCITKNTNELRISELSA